MNKEKSLKEAYLKLLEVGFGDGPLEKINQFIDDDVMGYGTAQDEKIMSIQEFRDLMIDQRKQAANFDQFSFTSKPVINRISDNGNTAVIVDEIVLLTRVQGESNELSVRMSTVFELRDGSWKLIHWHGSKPEHISGGDDPWHVNEWKKKNAELQKAVDEKTLELVVKNCELEIETALEKVRTIAMGMRKPDDMLDVCKTISNQLQSLGVKEIRNLQTAIFYEQRGTYMNYEFYAKHDKNFITETVYTNNVLHNEFATKMLKGKGEVFITHINGEEVKDWIAYQKTTNMFIDKYLETASSLNYYWFSLGPVALGISTYGPLTEDEINLFKRFLKVFELAYQRYLDIEKAESQAREAQIEASLERVRAVAMGMNKSDDLLSICEISFKEFKKLGFDNIRNALIHIQYDNQKYFMDYDFSDLTGGAITKIEYGSHPVVEDYLRQIRSAKDAFYQGVIKEDQLEEWKDFRRNSGQIYDPRLDKATALYYYFFSIGIGDIGISTFKSIDESQIKILKRFRNVFDLAYRRYTDITKAEAQAREAKIEAALEKVRSRSLAMHESNELQDVVTTVFERMKELNIEMDSAQIAIFNDGNKDFEFWIATPNQNRTKSFRIEEWDFPLIKDLFKARRKRLDFWSKRYSFEEKNQWFNYAFKNTDFRFHSKERKRFLLDADAYSLSIAFSRNTGIQVNNFSGKLLTESEIDILKRFAKVFEQAYVRFLDLQKAEAQAREAQIEAALERVRSRSLAMHHTSELQDVINTVHQQFRMLDIAITGGVFIAINEENKNEITCWGAGGATDYVECVRFPFLDRPIITGLIAGIQKGPGFFTEEFSHEEKIEFFNHLFKHPPFSDASPERKKELLSRQGGYTRSCTVSKYTSVFIINHHGRKFLEEENNVLIRFGNVFEQSYVRFLDLQKAEAQTREAKIEAALERVRSRTMGMQRSEELKDVIQLVYEQFVQLKIQTEHAGFIMDYKTRDDFHSWIADRFGTPSQITIPYFDCIYYNRFNDAKTKGLDFFTVTLSFEEKNKFYNDLFNHIPGFPEESKKIIFEAPAFAISTVLLENVALYIENFAGVPYSEEENKILIRFGKVFQQTYTRFLDLQRAETQNKIIQAENDRKSKELEDARQLQLSMLPKELPQLSNLDIAVHMKTATEVGGDYYDFNVDANGTLTFVVGDATGHGMMSGMMVSIMKSFFISKKANIELKQFFESANNSIKDMHLGRLMMSFMGVQITPRKLIATNAGMPSLIYFRNKSQKAGEFVSNNLPLGGMKGTKYLLKEIRYEKGDTLLLMSDGFAELKNKNNEQFGYPRIIEEFRSFAHNNSEMIVEHLKNSASDWMNGIEPDDDVTFVVIKVIQ